MIRKSISSLLFIFCFNINSAYAKQEFIINYASAKIQSVKRINGFNLKYQVTLDDPFSFITSFTYLHGNINYNNQYTNNTFSSNQLNIKYYTLMLGPDYRIYDFVSTYFLFGANYYQLNNSYSNTTYNPSGNNYISSSPTNENKNKITAAFGLGIKIYLPLDWIIDIGYEGSMLEYRQRNHTTNGVNIGIGYQF